MLTIKCYALVLIILPNTALRGPYSENDLLREHFRNTDHATVEKLEREHNKTVLCEAFIDFDEQKLKPISEMISSSLDFENLRSLPHASDIENDLRTIETWYGDFIKFIVDLKRHQTSSDDGTREVNMRMRLFNMTMKMRNLYGAIFGKRQLISTIIKKSKENWCTNEPTSTQQMIFKIYNIMALSELKYYIVIRFNNLYNDRFNDDRRKLTKAKTLFMKTIKGAPVRNDVRRCDPKLFIRDKNCIQFTKLLQGFITNLEGKNSLQDYHNKCAGDVMDCMPLSPRGKVCLSSFPNRRYDYIEKSESTLGKRQYCKNSSIVNLKSEHEICLCDDQTNSDRFISLHPVRANVIENRVITGIKLVKLDRIVHMQIQEGALLPYGYIDQATVHWVPVRRFNITDKHTFAGTDFFLLSSKSRTIALDEVEVDLDNYVVTGIAFQYIKDWIQLVIEATEFDWSSGKLVISTTKPLMKDPNLRYILNLSQSDIPVYGGRSIMGGVPSLLINFTNTDLTKDAAQTTIPFLDAQEVASVPATPLSGAGLFYKGRYGYGGFIAPVIKTYNYLGKN